MAGFDGVNDNRTSEVSVKREAGKVGEREEVGGSLVGGG